MAIRNDSEDPVLVPLGESLPGIDKLFRSPEEMPDYQFELLAAAWAEGDLDSDSLSEIEKIFAVSPERKIYAQGFKKIKLKPSRDKWAGRNSLLKSSPASVRVRNGIFITLTSAAAILVLFMITPLAKKTTTSTAPGNISLVSTPALIKASEAIEKISPAITIPRGDDFVVTASGPETELSEDVLRISGINLDYSIESSRLTSKLSPGNPGIVPVKQITVTTPEIHDDPNWIMRSITAMTNKFTREEKPVDGYMIAGICVKGINSVLGWEMELEKNSTPEGEPVSVSFSSSLLSFSSPVKKNSPQP